MSKKIRTIVIFAAVVVVIQGFALLFLTSTGMEKLYPLFVRASAEKIETDSNSYVAYYNTRKQVAEADLIVIGADEAVAESYDMLGHFSRFLKQYNNFSDVFFDIDIREESYITEIFDGDGLNDYYNALSNLKTRSG